MSKITQALEEVRTQYETAVLDEAADAEGHAKADTVYRETVAGKGLESVEARQCDLAREVARAVVERSHNRRVGLEVTVALLTDAETRLAAANQA